MFVLKIHFEFLVGMSVLGYPELKTMAFSNVSLSIASESVRITECILTKFTKKFGQHYGRKKLF